MKYIYSAYLPSFSFIYIYRPLVRMKHEVCCFFFIVRAKAWVIALTLIIAVTKAIFNCDLHDVQYPLVLLVVWHTLRIVGIIFHSATRHVLVASLARSKDCRNTRIKERGKRYFTLFIWVFINRNVYNHR